MPNLLEIPVLTDLCWWSALLGLGRRGGGLWTARSVVNDGWLLEEMVSTEARKNMGLNGVYT
jgi:hypothetical protein